ncbi:MAG: tetratricopeptide repeat protein [Nitrospiraceae bacterium]
MNRAQRRSQEKGHPRGPAQAEIQSWLAQGSAHHKAGRLAQAEPFYQQILALDPHHAEALHLLGLLAYQVGKLEQAVELLTHAIQNDSSQAPYRFNLGIVLQTQGKLDEAASAYEKAIRLFPAYAEAWSNLGNIRLEQGRPAEAVSSYRKAVEANPAYVEAHNTLGVALKEQGQLDEAAACYRRALGLKPNHLEAQCNLGIALMEQGRLDDAIVAYRQTLDLSPGYAKAQTNLGFACLWQGRLDEALRWFRAAADARQNLGKPVTPAAVHRSRIKHEIEQLDRLIERGLIPLASAACLNGWKRLQQRAGELPAGSLFVPVGQDEAADIAPSFNRILHYADCPALPGGVLNPALDVAAIEARYAATKPGVTYVDGLLSREALESLRRFCLDSTIWKKEYANGYVGAFIGEGFSCPLFLQLSEELRLRFPGIFKGHRLMQAWSFKCDSESKALNLHADAAAVNVNFWITPAEAQLDHEQGGLIVWDKEAPKEWHFRAFNSSAHEPKVREFLRSSGAKAVTVPYRQNRAINFNSDLFHESATMMFKDDYESRRINITLLYGRRGA